MTEEKLKEYKGKAQAKLDEVFRILEGEGSLTLWLVKCTRVGMPMEDAVRGLTAIKEAVDDAIATYHAAIAQPEPKIRKTRVAL